MPRNKLTLPLLILIVVAVLILILSKLNFLNFAQNSIAQMFAPIQYSVRKLILRPNLSSLQQQNLELSKQLVNQDQIREDNKALRDQFATTSIRSQVLLPADIVGSPGETLILNKGLSDDVKEGMAVVYQDNLIGIVGKTTDNFSIVNLISSSSFGTTAQTLTNHAQGTVKGEGAGEIILDNVVLSQKLNNGELVATKGDVNDSGVGLAPGLIIGKISSINNDPSSLFQTAKLQPLIDPSQLSAVFVLVGQ